MKRLFSITMMLVAAVILSATAFAKGTPKAVISEKSFDFGTVKQTDKAVTHVFTLTNEGDAPLVIISASASCGCTRPTYTAEPIAPGAKGEVKVTFIPTGQRGEINKEVKVRTNAPEAKRLTLRITGTVTP